MGVARLWSIALKISEFVAFLYSAETMTLHWDDWVVYYEKFPRLVSWSPPPTNCKSGYAPGYNDSASWSTSLV